ncbi:MAG: hypothetical protein JZD40_02120, partial [Sulfolobus sp.]|nr:hypothetical protein [Sulfolobus sp.]
MLLKQIEKGSGKLLIPFLFLMLLVTLTPPIATAHQYVSGHAILLNQVESLNWAGYVVASSFSNPQPVVTEVYGSWIVQSVMPSKAATYSSQWVGIGGFFSGDNSLIQTGTLSYSDHGKTYYSAWYELLPAPATTITNFKVKPGDIMQAEIFVVKIINSTTQEWNITLNDLTEHEHFSILVNYSSS